MRSVGCHFQRVNTLNTSVRGAESWLRPRREPAVMGMSLGDLFTSGLLILNAIAVLHEERFLAKRRRRPCPPGALRAADFLARVWPRRARVPRSSSRCLLPRASTPCVLSPQARSARVAPVCAHVHVEPAAARLCPALPRRAVDLTAPVCPLWQMAGAPTPSRSR